MRSTGARDTFIVTVLLIGLLKTRATIVVAELKIREAIGIRITVTEFVLAGAARARRLSKYFL